MGFIEGVCQLRNEGRSAVDLCLDSLDPIFNADNAYPGGAFMAASRLLLAPCVRFAASCSRPLTVVSNARAIPSKRSCPGLISPLSIREIETAAPTLVLRRRAEIALGHLAASRRSRMTEPSASRSNPHRQHSVQC